MLKARPGSSNRAINVVLATKKQAVDQTEYNNNNKVPQKQLPQPS